MNENLKRVKLAKEIEDPYYLKDPKLLELYKRCLPPRDAYYYFPKGNEIIVHNPNKPKKSLRRIYYNVPYTDKEKKWLQDFKNLISSHPETQLPDYIKDYLLLAIIYATSCDLEDSYKRLVDYLKFCKETFPVVISPLSKIIEILNKGFVYVYGRDHRFRPIVVCQFKTFQIFYKNYQMEDILKATYFLSQFIVNNMLIPGQFESWVFIVNISGVSIISLPEPVKKVIPALSNFFFGRLYKNYLIGLNFISRIIYKITCAFLDDVTVQKINVVDGKNDPKLFECIRRDNIEEQFGGTAPNLPVDAENGFFPPRMPTDKFIKDEENPRDVLITEDEYINKYKNGEIPEECVSPYIYETLKKEEEKKITQIENVEEKQEPIPQNLTKSEQRTPKMTIEKPNVNIQRKSVNNSLYKKDNEKILKRKENLIKVKKFMYSNWNFDDELSFPKYHTINCKLLREDNILDDINNFAKKKLNFTKKISIFNSIKNSYYNNA